MSYNKGEVFFESRDKIILLRLSNNRQQARYKELDTSFLDTECTCEGSFFNYVDKTK